MSKLERSFLNLTATEIRAESEDGKNFISGYASVFNEPTDKMGFREVVKPGAFSRALKEKQDVRALFNHDPSAILGRSTAGTLTLSEDKKGLKFRCEMPDTTYGRDVMTSIKRGDISQCSFGFRAVKQAWVNEPDPEDNTRTIATRELHDVDLGDVSAVTYPAYDGTSVSQSRSYTTVELRSYFPEGIPEDVAENVTIEIRTGTKSVSGEEVPMSKFAYVGDPDKKDTWKLPIHDKIHAQEALARFDQTEGIPADKKAAVKAKVVAAAKKFGIHVDESKSESVTDEQRQRMKMQLQLSESL
jgi:HK97 family phage prohead protease